MFLYKISDFFPSFPFFPFSCLPHLTHSVNISIYPSQKIISLLLLSSSNLILSFFLYYFIKTRIPCLKKDLSKVQFMHNLYMHQLKLKLRKNGSNKNIIRVDTVSLIILLKKFIQ